MWRKGFDLGVRSYPALYVHASVQCNLPPFVLFLHAAAVVCNPVLWTRRATRRELQTSYNPSNHSPNPSQPVCPKYYIQLPVACVLLSSRVVCCHQRIQLGIKYIVNLMRNHWQIKLPNINFIRMIISHKNHPFVDLSEWRWWLTGCPIPARIKLQLNQLACNNLWRGDGMMAQDPLYSNGADFRISLLSFCSCPMVRNLHI